MCSIYRNEEVDQRFDQREITGVEQRPDFSVFYTEMCYSDRVSNISDQQ